MLMILNSKGLVKSKEIADIHIGTKAGRYDGYYLEQKSFLLNIHFQSSELASVDMK